MTKLDFRSEQWKVIRCQNVHKNKVADMAKIFWVEDQSHWISKLKDSLLNADLDGQTNEVNVFKFSEAAKQHIKLSKKEDEPDIAILDARMNGIDQAGFSVSKALLSKWPNIPIIFLSEHNGTQIERDALEQFNATDFISKHQRNVEEVLCWRIKAAMRQATLRSDSNTDLPSNIIVNGDLKIDLDSWEVYWHGNKLMNPDNPKRPLAPTPRKMLRCLVERSPRPVTPSQMAEYLNLDPDTYAAATYRQHIKTLRRAFDSVENVESAFSNACKNGHGIVATGDAGAYCWRAFSK